MNRTPALVRSGMMTARLGIVLLLLAACTTKQPRATADVPDVPHEAGVAPARTEQVASVEGGAAPADAGPSLPSAEPAGVAWTDAENIDGLVKDCAYAPAGVTRPKGTDRDFWGDGTPLSCEYGMYGQSCSADPCFDEQKRQCSPKCQKTCESCGASCVTSCAAGARTDGGAVGASWMVPAASSS